MPFLISIFNKHVKKIPEVALPKLVLVLLADNSWLRLFSVFCDKDDHAGVACLCDFLWGLLIKEPPTSLEA